MVEVLGDALLGPELGDGLLATQAFENDAGNNPRAKRCFEHNESREALR
jgi:hypothetical protein